MANPNYLLSKSSFIKGLQCLKYLYLYKYYNKLRDPLPDSRRALFKRGRDVGKLAWKLFPGGVDASPPSTFQYDKSVELTRKLIARGEQVIYEAAFAHGRVLCALDILVNKDEKWYAYEVKSSARVSPVYIRDAALQFHIISKSGLELEDFMIVHINKNYVRNGDLSVQGLFTEQSVMKEVKKQQNLIEEMIIVQKETLRALKEPDVIPGPHCFQPYDCDFIGHCWKEMKEQTVFNMGGMSRKEQFELYNAGIRNTEDIPVSYGLNKTKRAQIEAENTGKPIVDTEFLLAFMQKLSYPLLLLDFEVCSFAVPVWDNTSPFEKIPFLFSAHCIARPGASTTHSHFLSPAGSKSEEELLKHFLEATKDCGCILVFDVRNEREVITRLMEKFPAHSNELQLRKQKLLDLMNVFSGKHFYLPGMRGSLNLKSISSAMQKTTSYNKLRVSNGLEAVQAYEQFVESRDAEEKRRLSESLVEYCRTDTLAMVEILNTLQSAITAR